MGWKALEEEEGAVHEEGEMKEEDAFKQEDCLRFFPNSSCVYTYT